LNTAHHTVGLDWIEGLSAADESQHKPAILKQVSANCMVHDESTLIIKQALRHDNNIHDFLAHLSPPDRPFLEPGDSHKTRSATYDTWSFLVL
jgi:hypothetical protein